MAYVVRGLTFEMSWVSVNCQKRQIFPSVGLHDGFRFTKRPIRPSVWLRANPKEHVTAERAATDGFVNAIEEAVAQDGQCEPVGGGEIGRELRIHPPTVRPGRA